ncbi:MAG: hypothetical protein AAE985_03475 [Thermoplasmataceae archaeon]|jgi:Arc/MetJ-type ribon-helix-helix transcriptional regulator
MSVKITLVIPTKIYEDINELYLGKYLSKQEFILAAIREKISKESQAREIPK